ncbi:hypothetical protein HDIA_1949 [Hartmannibacter diazotrophicus]|uniref:Uncharacterized protein n=1 Tax=Hartmannibacter diazotrophicus TaxID=1482074 RepID=A0A2C9D5M6_9HYPH|nr:hypothetical protein HDIA_1949 [Hartmannibacter diazotrophicus]
MHLDRIAIRTRHVAVRRDCLPEAFRLRKGARPNRGL